MSESVHRVGGDALGGVDGGGVAETGRLADIVGGEPDGEVAAGVPDGQVTLLADLGDGPAVPVLDPVGGGETEPAVVARVMITSPTLARFPSARDTSDAAGV